MTNLIWVCVLACDDFRSFPTAHVTGGGWNSAIVFGQKAKTGLLPNFSLNVDSHEIWCFFMRVDCDRSGAVENIMRLRWMFLRNSRIYPEIARLGAQDLVIISFSFKS